MKNQPPVREQLLANGAAAVDARVPQWPTGWMDTTGVVFVATGRRFVQEAELAAGFVRRSNHGLRVCLVTDVADYGRTFWDDLVLVSNPQMGFRDKILMGLCPYRRFLYLDTDAHVFRDLSDFWPMLDRFDFVGHQLFEGHDCPLPGIPDAFPEFQGGVLGFRRSAKTAGFFGEWLRNYDRFFRLNEQEQPHYSNVSDQKSLRLTVWDSDVNVGVLGPEYNFTPNLLVFACALVRIFHGRAPQGRMDSFEKRINRRLGNRAYVPRLGAVVSDDMPISELVRLWFSATGQFLRLLGRAVVPRWLRDGLRRIPLVRRMFLGDGFQDHERQKEQKFVTPVTEASADETPRL